MKILTKIRILMKILTKIRILMEILTKIRILMKFFISIISSNFKGANKGSKMVK